MKQKFGAVFGLPFLGGGLTMLYMLWSGDRNFPPLPMKIFGSLVCIPVSAVGAFIIYSGLFGKSKTVSSAPINSGTQGPSSSVSNDRLSCHHCGAATGTDCEISPSGDVKCEYCDSWYNVRKA